MSNQLGVKGGEGRIGMQRKRKGALCDCENCRTQRFLYCEGIEQRIEAKRVADKHSPTPAPNAPSTLRLQ